MQNAGCGFGYLALAGLTAQAASRSARIRWPPSRRIFAPRAKRVIFLFMQGGVSQVDSFDYKPRLDQDDGKMHAFDDARALANTGMRGITQRVMKPLWKFAQHGAVAAAGPPTCSREITRHVDDLCFLHSMHTEGMAHGPATLFLHCGSTNFDPAVDGLVGASTAWARRTRTCPASSRSARRRATAGRATTATPSCRPSTRARRWARPASPASEATIRNLANRRSRSADQRRQFDLLQELNAEQLKRTPGDSRAGSGDQLVSSWPGGCSSTPRTCSTWPAKRRRRRRCTASARRRPTISAGSACWPAGCARRACASSRSTYGDNTANPAWDQHSNLPKHADHARAVDQPIAGLLADLKRRGLLEDTLVWWGGEFGRTPYAEKNGTGRDHNPGGFTVWLAGGGVKPGFAYGATDEFGHMRRRRQGPHARPARHHPAPARPDHEKLTYRYAGRDFRLTDVYGEVVHDLLA